MADKIQTLNLGAYPVPGANRTLSFTGEVNDNGGGMVIYDTTRPFQKDPLFYSDSTTNWNWRQVIRSESGKPYTNDNNYSANEKKIIFNNILRNKADNERASYINKNFNPQQINTTFANVPRIKQNPLSGAPGIGSTGTLSGAGATVYADPTSPITLETEFGVEEFSKPLYKYPLSTIDDKTDYILINVKKYTPVGAPLIRARGSFNSPEQKIIDQNAIILPMPSNIQDGNSVSYADGSLDGITAAVADYALDTMKINISDPSRAGEEMTRNTQAVLGKITDAGLKEIYLRGLAAQAANLPGVGNITKEQILARESGGILNPNMELLFNGVALRSFRFSFKLTPRNEDEAKEIKDIIRIFKINMAPKVVKGGNTYLSTPNVFDLQYMQGNIPHPFLHRFKTCALTDMSVNYTGEGIYATYRDATPNSMIMDLTFKELEPIFDSDYKGIGGVGY